MDRLAQGDGQLDGPFGIGVLLNNNIVKNHIVVADRKHNRVRVFDQKGNHVKDIGGGAIFARGRILVIESSNHKISVFELELPRSCRRGFGLCSVSTTTTTTVFLLLCVSVAAALLQFLYLFSQILYSSRCLCGLGPVLLSQPADIVKVLSLCVQGISHGL